MEKTLSDLQLPMDIVDECMLQREKRTDIDQCHDEVEKCLTKVCSSCCGTCSSSSSNSSSQPIVVPTNAFYRGII